MSDNANPTPEVSDEKSGEENLSFPTAEPIHAEEMGIDDQLEDVETITVENEPPHAYAEADIPESVEAASEAPAESVEPANATETAEATEPTALTEPAAADEPVVVEEPTAVADSATVGVAGAAATQVIEPLPYIPVETPPAPPADEADPDTDAEDGDEPKPARGTIDLGLLILRAMLGIVMALDGADKLFGLLGGSLTNTQEMMSSVGFTNHTELWAILLGVLELVAGIIVALGIFAPLGGAVLLATLGVTILVEIAQGAGEVSGMQNLAVLLPACLAAMASAVILVGAGRWAVDGAWKWATKPKWGALVWWILGIAAGPVFWALANTQGFPF